MPSVRRDRSKCTVSGKQRKICFGGGARAVPNVIKLFSIGNLDVGISSQFLEHWKSSLDLSDASKNCAMTAILLKELKQGKKNKFTCFLNSYRIIQNFRGNYTIEISDGKKLYNIGHGSWKRPLPLAKLQEWRVPLHTNGAAKMTDCHLKIVKPSQLRARDRPTFFLKSFIYRHSHV